MKIAQRKTVTTVVFAPLALGAIALAAPAVAAPAFMTDEVSGCPQAQFDGGEPAGGTGVDTGPQTAPDVPGIPEGSCVADSSAVGQDAGGTGDDPGLVVPPDTSSGPGLNDGGEPAGAIG